MWWFLLSFILYALCCMHGCWVLLFSFMIPKVLCWCISFSCYFGRSQVSGWHTGGTYVLEAGGVGGPGHRLLMDRDHFLNEAPARFHVWLCASTRSVVFWWDDMNSFIPELIALRTPFQYMGCIWWVVGDGSMTQWVSGRKSNKYIVSGLSM